MPREEVDYTSFNDSLVHVIHGKEGQLYADQGDSGSLIVRQIGRIRSGVISELRMDAAKY